MNLRHHRQNLIERVAAIPALNLANLNPLDAQKTKLEYAKHLCSVVAESLGDLGDDTRINGGVFLGCVRMAPEIYDSLEQILLSECVAAIEAEEKNALDAYVLEDVA